MSKAYLTDTGFQDLHQYEFVSKTDGDKDWCSIHISKIANLDKKIHALENEIKSFDIEAKREELKKQGNEYLNKLKPRNGFILFLNTVIWTILYCILAYTNTGLFAMFISFLFKEDLEFLPITILILIVYLFSVIAFIKYNIKIDSCLEREDNDIGGWSFIMCIPIFSAFSTLFCILIGAKEFYNALDTAIYRCSRKGQRLLLQADYVHSMVDELESRLDELHEQRWKLIRQLSATCCCEKCKNGLPYTNESGLELYECLKAKGEDSNLNRGPNCICNVKRNK